jgi:hypothetical protein
MLLAPLVLHVVGEEWRLLVRLMMIMLLLLMNIDECSLLVSTFLVRFTNVSNLTGADALILSRDGKIVLQSRNSIEAVVHC